MTALPPRERERRRANLREAMAAAELDALVAYAPAWRRENVRYLTGEPVRSAAAFAYLAAAGDVTATGAFGLEELPDLTAQMRADLTRGATVGVAHAELLPVALWRALSAALPGIELRSATSLMEAVRLVKSDWELDQIRHAASICDLGWAAFVAALAPGVAEHEIVAEVEHTLKLAGAEDNFMIIASGGDEVRGMTPPSSRRVGTGDMVRTELTPQWRGYWAQICRSAVVGRANTGQRQSGQVFEEAVAAGLATVRPGVTAHDVAKAENDVFRSNGLGQYCTAEYTRVRGHGHGLHLDEFPVIEGSETVLEPGVVLVVHPNTYTPLAGYHVLGDPVVVTADGHEPLLESPRRLEEVAA